MVESIQISTEGIIPNLHLGEGGLPQDCLAEGAKRVGSGSDGAVLDEWMRDVTLLSAEAKEGRQTSHGRFRSGVCFRYIDLLQNGSKMIEDFLRL